MGFVWFSLLTVIISLNDFDKLIIVMVKCTDWILKYLEGLWLESFKHIRKIILRMRVLVNTVMNIFSIKGGKCLD
jgi:hypothetical protein